MMCNAVNVNNYLIDQAGFVWQAARSKWRIHADQNA
jgi:hypothetical protein